MVLVVPLDIGEEGIGYVEWAGFLGDEPVFASVLGQLHRLGERHQVIDAHDGLLAAVLSQEGNMLVTSGEDGKVVGLDCDGKSSVFYHSSGKWIDRLATGPSGAIAFSWGKKGIVLTGSGEQRPFECERTVEGIAFQPKGLRIALARYNGVDLKWVNTNNPPQFLKWAGAHNAVSYSPDGKYIVSTMQENALHGWRLSDNKDMRMSGYPSKVKSVSWSAKGKWLTTSGAPAAIVWPFFGKDGPMGKAPKELGAMGQNLVSQVCCHPSEDVVAIGYSDGMILAVRIEDGKEAVLRQGGKGTISALGWDRSGQRIAYGSEAGEAGVINLAG